MYSPKPGHQDGRHEPDRRISGENERVALDPCPTAALIKSAVERARDARDETIRAVLRLAAASIAAGARLLASVVSQWVAQRITRKSRNYDSACTTSHSD